MLSLILHSKAEAVVLSTEANGFGRALAGEIKPEQMHARYVAHHLGVGGLLRHEACPSLLCCHMVPNTGLAAARTALCAWNDCPCTVMITSVYSWRFSMSWLLLATSTVGLAVPLHYRPWPARSWLIYLQAHYACLSNDTLCTEVSTQS